MNTTNHNIETIKMGSECPSCHKFAFLETEVVTGCGNCGYMICHGFERPRELRLFP